MDENEYDDGDFPQEQIETSGRGRGGSLSGISAALSRPVSGNGLEHWGGRRPRREPVDVAGRMLPGRGALPSNTNGA